MTKPQGIEPLCPACHLDRKETCTPEHQAWFRAKSPESWEEVAVEMNRLHVAIELGDHKNWDIVTEYLSLKTEVLALRDQVKVLVDKANKVREYSERTAAKQIALVTEIERLRKRNKELENADDSLQETRTRVRGTGEEDPS